MKKDGLSIGEVSARTGLSAHTLRYYEKFKLLTRVRRGNGGSRRYLREDIAWIEFLLRLRATGMPLNGIRRFADLRRAGPRTVPARLSLLAEHRDRLKSHIEQLNTHLEALDAKVQLYQEMLRKRDKTHVQTRNRKR